FSQLESRSTDDGTNYVGHLIYSWETKGSQYSSARRSFFGNVGGTRSEIQEYLDAHPVGSKIACFLDPATPTDAVLERGFRLKMAIGLIPLFAFFIGYRMFVWGIRRPQSPFASRSTVTAIGPNGTSMSIGVSGPLELKPEISRSTSFVGTLFFALVWNGIVSIFLYNIYKDWGSSGIHWGIALFMFPFVVIGVLLIVAVPFAFLGMFSPKLNLRVNSGVVRIGDRMQLSWNVDGKAERVSKLTFELIGQEEATYRRGTDSVTDKNVFFTAQQSTTNVSGSLARGEISFEIPATTVPSFQSPSGNNKIAWSVKVTGEVIRFPNFTDVYPIPVFPLTKEGLSKHVQSSS
ncbi:MAG: hypothetical protein IT290_04550, partial [Deltaproteobacteria bacterium]|nr:hypothetical protein [Deltaproteobacteria bacterium]